MAIKILKDKTINVRATEKDVAILDTLAEAMKCSKGDVISKALLLLLKDNNANK
ncbi:MAG: hypothetical protein ACRCST_16120 [Turicibacter sp.]